MKDFKGNKLNIGDKVVFVRRKGTNVKLDTGTITKFYKGYFEEECSVDNHPHVLSCKIMKL